MAHKAPSLPAALKPLIDLNRWVVWRWEVTKKGKPTKVPYQAHHPERKASTKAPETWAPYAVAAKVRDVDGIGFVLTDTEFAAFDIDDCRNASTGEIHPWATNLVERAGSYTEITTSGTGLRIIGLAKTAVHHRKQPVIDGVTCEAYSHATRYIAMTGNQLNGAGLENIDTVMDEVVAELDELKKKKPKPKPTPGEGKTDLPRELRLMLHLQGDKPGEYPSRSELFWAFICTALRKGIDENVIVVSCCDETYSGKSIYEHVQDNGGEDYVKRQIEKAANEGPTSTDEDNKVIIRIQGGKLHNEWRAVQDALIRAKCSVFVRGKKLVRPLWRWERTGEGDREALTSWLQELKISTLGDIVAHHAAKFQKLHKTKTDEEWIDINPPKAVIEQLIDNEDWAFSTLKGIINTPTMKPDGSLLTEPGYDNITQLYYLPSSDIKLPPIPERPAKADAQAALARLNGLLKNFPFEGENEKKKTSPSRSVALAGIMTTVLRGALPTAVPLFAIVGTESRTGKTYLVTLISLIAMGHVPISQGGSEKKEELEKRIETAALAGRPILHLNNLPNGMVVESERLSELSTEGAVYIRTLGRHEERLCDCRGTTMFLNGNNILMAADLVLRTATCRLNPQREDPETKEYDSPTPTELVRRDRSRYLADVFIIARAFLAAGCPKQDRKIVAGFDDWSRFIQQTLIWLGQDDPLKDMDMMRGMDPKEEELQRLLNTLKKYHNKLKGKFTVADCTELAEETAHRKDGSRFFVHEDLRELMYQHGKIDGQHFGRLLMRNRDRIREGWQVRIAPAGKRTKAYELVGPSAKDVASPPKDEPSEGGEDVF
jgi:putative DNA primase/helicase